MDLQAELDLLVQARASLHLLSKRYQPADFDHRPQSELQIDAAGTMIATGIDPLDSELLSAETASP